MNLHIAQHAEHDGKNTWHWSIWLDGPPSDLDQVEQVEYTLHPTFPHPVHLIDDRSTNFRMKASGWGEFEIQARARTRDGEWHPMRHWLTLRTPDAQRAPTRGLRSIEPDPIESTRPPAPIPSVYITGRDSDRDLIETAKAKLADRGFTVSTTDDFRQGVPYDIEFEATIARADAVVAILSGRPSLSLERELDAAAARGVPVIPIKIGDQPEMLERLVERASQEIRERGAA